MSRIPPPSSSRSTTRAPTTPVKSRGAAPLTPRVRTQSTKSTTPSKPSSKPVVNAAPSQDTPPPPLSIKEAIALRRAEAKKAQSKLSSGPQHDFLSLDDASPVPAMKQEDEDILGRWPIRETIERARSSGSLNLATRSLPCIPSALFEIHLGITPDPLKSVPNEPVLPPSAPSDAPKRGGKRDNPAWFEAQDLQVLKIWNNEIVEIQHEISLFGSLKTIDLHQNKLRALPDTFADLTCLTVLDLSRNALTSLPTNLFALPELTTLNVSHNSLTSLPFNAPFASRSNDKGRQASSGSFFAPAITRSTSPLPRLINLDASHNKISAKNIDLELPKSLTKVDLSSNPLGTDEPRCRSLLQALGALPRLKELRFDGAEIGNDAFLPGLFSLTPFASLRILDLGRTKVTLEATKEALKGMKQQITYDITTEDPPEGFTRVIVGKKIIKEAWEIEAERQAKVRRAKHGDLLDDWETLSASNAGTRTNGSTSRAEGNVSPTPAPPKPREEVVKESWEIEAEQGLLTEGGKRRARAAAAAAAAKDLKAQSGVGIGNPSQPTEHSASSSSSGLSLANPQYYSQTTQTLTLPPSSPPTKTPAHTRTFSLAAPSLSSVSSVRTTDIAVPPPTLPLSAIVAQPFANTLRVLILTKRRLDKSFSLPGVDAHDGFLPNLEELNLEDCGLADLVAVTRSSPSSGTVTPPRTSEMILPLISKLFPSLRTLDLSHNALTSASLTTSALSNLILAAPETGRKGLKHLRLKGNALTELEAFQGLAESFKGNRQVPEWHLDELDIRDNAIGKLPPELGLLPMDVFLVDGNTFRIPQRRVWEREGTKATAR
ncbi:putative leucine rich repeat [Lyophyllum shimeji]|uniref:Leucine rich repeat n=1 Tax=Lyophyllum shimeji TaxID=47721 RepID=A0A9P3UMK9_LYOSH|nr:putative leucine rich repeat [Lyophyllum shimeji]